MKKRSVYWWTFLISGLFWAIGGIIYIIELLTSYFECDILGEYFTFSILLSMILSWFGSGVFLITLVVWLIHRRKMTRRFLVLGGVVIGSLLIFGIVFWPRANPQESTNGIPASSLVFRSSCPSVTMYLILHTNQTYCFVARHHVMTAESDYGKWTQDTSGEMTLESQSETNTKGNTNVISHVTAVQYDSRVILISPDHKFISIAASSFEKAKKMFDYTKAGKTPRYLFVQVKPEQAAEEKNTPQPFMFYPELNMPRPHPVLQLKRTN